MSERDTPDGMPLWGPHRGGHLIGAGLVILAVGVVLSVIGVPAWMALVSMYAATQIYYRTGYAAQVGSGVPWGPRPRGPRRPPEDRDDWPGASSTPR